MGINSKPIAGASYAFPIDMTMDDDAVPVAMVSDSQAEAKVGGGQAEAKVSDSKAEVKVGGGQAEATVGGGAQAEAEQDPEFFPLGVRMFCCNMTEMDGPRTQAPQKCITYQVRAGDDTTYEDVIRMYMSDPIHEGQSFKFCDVKQLSKVFKAELYELDKKGEVSDTDPLQLSTWQTNIAIPRPERHAVRFITDQVDPYNAAGQFLQNGQLLHLTTSLPSIRTVAVRAFFTTSLEDVDRESIEPQEYYMPEGSTFGDVIRQFIKANKDKIVRTELVGQIHYCLDKLPVDDDDDDVWRSPFVSVTQLIEMDGLLSLRFQNGWPTDKPDGWIMPTF
jgi:hypothetical protein